MPRPPRLLPVRIIGDAILRQKASPVGTPDDSLREFAADLTLTMYERDGVGLAAPQVGVSKRVIVVDPHWSKDGQSKQPLVMLDPVIESSAGQTETEEGCISLPGIYANVERPNRIKVSYTDLEGGRQSLELEGYHAVVIQHEYDHLDGILFVDRLGTIARLKLKRRLKDLERTACNGENFLRTD